MYRRNFLTLAATAITASSLALRAAQQSSPTSSPSTDIFMIGPLEGYSLQIGTLVSMMINMRAQVVHNVQGLLQPDLDFLLDSKANSIGALLLHLAATDTYYHLHTFQEKPWDSWDDAIKKQWDIPMNLGDRARETIKGHDLKYYLDILEETRAKTFAEFRKRDDKWLLSRDKVSPTWGNYYSEWFHVCEHESNHDGQIKFLKARLPNAKADHTAQ